MAVVSSSDKELPSRDENIEDKRVKLSYFGPRLLPCVISALVYIAAVPMITSPPTELVAFLKCLPILTIICFVFWYDNFRCKDQWHYSRLVLLGLLFSMLGDWFLVYDALFLPGMAAFAAAHACYIFAFGMKPLRPLWWIFFLPLSASIYAILYPGLDSVVMKVAVLVYALLISCMSWRAVAKFATFDDFLEGLNGQNGDRWRAVVAAVGASVFMVSDILLAVNRFAVEIPYQRTLVISTYYVAQMCIGVSVVRPKGVKTILLQEESLPDEKEPTLNGEEGEEAAKSL